MIKNEKKTLWLLINLIPFIGGLASVIAVSYTFSNYGEEDEERPFNVIPLMIFFIAAAIGGACSLLSIATVLKWLIIYVCIAASGALDVLYLFFELSPERLRKKEEKKADSRSRVSELDGNSEEK